MMLHLAQPDTPMLLLAFANGALAAVFTTLSPWLVGRAIDAASLNPDEPLFKATALGLLAVGLTSGVVGGVRRGLFRVAASLLDRRMRCRLFAALLSFEVSTPPSPNQGHASERQ